MRTLGLEYVAGGARGGGLVASTGLAALADESFCYLTTTGRRTGRPHEIEIWFALRDDALFLLAGGGERADWVRNLVADPSVQLRIDDRRFDARAEVVPASEDDGDARRLLAAKYQDWEEGRPLSDWAASALLVRISHLSPLSLAK